eukprot:gene2792-12667_t
MRRQRTPATGLVCVVLIAKLWIHASACEDSGMCSAGLLAPFFGNIKSGEVLRATLAARSFKKEVILMATSSHFIAPITQALMNLRRMGMEHAMILSTEVDECIIVNHHLPTYGYRTLARSIRLGYNVLCTDTDVIFFHDPYKLLELCSKTTALPNGGLVYVQNAAPNGPASWLISEVSNRLYRFIDSDFKRLKELGMTATCNYMDQDAFGDALGFVRSGMMPLQQKLQRRISATSNPPPSPNLPTLTSPPNPPNASHHSNAPPPTHNTPNGSTHTQMLGKCSGFP